MMKFYLLFQIFTLLSAMITWTSFCVLGYAHGVTRSFLTLLICYLVQAVLLVPYCEREQKCGAWLDWRSVGACLISAMPIPLVACYLSTLNVDVLRISGMKIMVFSIVLVFVHGGLYSIAAASIQNLQRPLKGEVDKNAGEFNKRDSM